MLERIKTHPQGPEFSRLSQGYWRLIAWQKSDQQLLSFIEKGLELGVTTADHADIYGQYRCEAQFGKALTLKPSLRNQLELVSKCSICLPLDARPQHQVHHYNTSAEHIVKSAERSLQNLNTDRLDCLLLHRPDPLMNADEVASAFDKLKADGKVLHFGVSNFTPSQFDLLQSRLSMPLVTNQIEISPINRALLRDPQMDHLQQHRVAPMAWSCLGGGTIFNGETEQSKRLISALEVVAHEVNTTDLQQVVYAWVLAMPSTPMPIIGSGKIERVKSAVKATRIKLSKEQWFKIWVASTGENLE